MLYELDIRNYLIIVYLVIYDKFVHVAYMWMAGCSVDFLRDISFILHNPFLNNENCGTPSGSEI